MKDVSKFKYLMQKNKVRGALFLKDCKKVLERPVLGNVNPTQVF
jgi:hypothetical protein